MAIKLDHDTDLDTDVNDLQREFKRIAPLIHAYSYIKAEASESYEIACAEYKELRSAKYLDFRSKEGKVTEATLDAMITTDKDVIASQRNMLTTKRDLDTIIGYVEGLRAKRDMLVQLGADARKE